MWYVANETVILLLDSKKDGHYLCMGFIVLMAHHTLYPWQKNTSRFHRWLLIHVGVAARDCPSAALSSVLKRTYVNAEENICIAMT